MSTFTISRKTFHRNMVIVILIGSVFVDLLNGFLNDYKSISFPVGVIFRTFITFYLIPYLIRYSKSKIFKLYIFITILWWFLIQFFWLNNNGYSLGREITQFSKIIYPSLLCIYFLVCISKQYIVFNDLIRWGTINVLVASLFILFSAYSGIGLSTYGNGSTSYGFGTTSFFKAQNDTSLSVLMGFCLSLYIFFGQNQKYSFIKSTLILFGLIFIGTRAGIMGGFLAVVLFVFQMLFFAAVKNMNGLIKKFGYFLLVLIGLITASYITYIKIKDKPYMVNRYIEILTNPPRAQLEDAAYQYIDKRGIASDLFGAGVGEYRTKLFGNLENKKAAVDADEGKDAEKDYVDLIGAYGYLFGNWVFLLPLISAFIAFRKYVKRPSNYLHFAMLIALLIFIGHSIIAGHGIKNPAVGTLLSILYVYVLLPFDPDSILRTKQSSSHSNI